MAFSVNDEIFYDHAVTKQPLIFKIAKNPFNMPELAFINFQSPPA
jgi:hypothetical protein